MGSERSEENIAAVVGSRELLPTRLGDALRNEITEAILQGRLKPGDVLPSEAQIAASNGVSKQVVREAVRELASLGLVHVQQGKATRVRALSAAPLGRFFDFAIRGSETGLSEAIELRRILEPSLARLAALRRTESDVEALKLIFGRLESAVGSVPRWIEADLDFHEAVATAAANRLARFQIAGLRPVIREVMVSFNSRERRGRAERRATVERHARVLRAIEARDGEAAEAAMTRHFEAAEQTIAELFPSGRGGAAGCPGREEEPLGRAADTRGRKRMKTDLTRRTLLGGATFAMGATFLPRGADAQGRPLSVFSHRVHQTVATGQAGDIAKAWADLNNVAVQWTTFDTPPLQERLFREASLGETSVDVGFLLNTQAVPRAASLFENLDPYQQRDPIEDFDDIFPGLREGMRVKGQLLAIPFRHATSGLHYNEEILAERGFSKPPSSIEELAEMAKACTYRRTDGTPVVGFLIPGVTYPNVIDIARAWNGDFITPDFKCVADQKPMLNAVRMLRELFQAGAFPRNFATLGTEEVNVWMQTGRAAFCLNSMGRNRIYNDPEKSRFPGKIKTVAAPSSKEIQPEFEVAPAKVEFWGMAIPKNAQRKELSWGFIKSMLTKENTLTAALNGNGPVRNSTYESPKFRASVPYAEEERRLLRVGRVPLPAFDEATRAGDYFKEELEAAVLGMKSPEDALAALCSRVQPLLPT